MLHALLERWAKLEPDRCKIVRQRESLTVFELSIATIEVEHSEDCDRKIAAIVQGAVQDAIVANGGDFIVQGAIPATSGVFAEVLKIGGNNYECACDRYGGVALLSAYLDWLEDELKPKELVAQSSSEEIPW